MRRCGGILPDFIRGLPDRPHLHLVRGFRIELGLFLSSPIKDLLSIKLVFLCENCPCCTNLINDGITHFFSLIGFSGVQITGR